MHPYFLFKDLVTIFVFFGVVAYVVCYVPNAIGHSDNYIPANPIVTPPSIVPEWYLLPYYTILRAVPNKLLGVVAMLGSLLILLAIPILDTSRVRGNQFRVFGKVLFWVLISDIVLLGYLGAQHAEEPWVTIGGIATIVYFSWYLIIVPIVGILENTLSDLALESDNKLSPILMHQQQILLDLLIYL